jgi:hypothetical protein
MRLFGTKRPTWVCIDVFDPLRCMFRFAEGNEVLRAWVVATSSAWAAENAAILALCTCNVVGDKTGATGYKEPVAPAASVRGLPECVRVSNGIVGTPVAQHVVSMWFNPGPPRRVGGRGTSWT